MNASDAGSGTSACTGGCLTAWPALTITAGDSTVRGLVVNGYAGGEWNPYGNYFVIRQSDAHSRRNSILMRASATQHLHGIEPHIRLGDAIYEPPSPERFDVGQLTRPADHIQRRDRRLAHAVTVAPFGVAPRPMSPGSP